ncbi:MAG: hypothetical protein ACK2UB_10265 [Anaerolineales bacterium]
MMNFDNARFITANFSGLQGWKTVPAGAVLFLSALWMNAQTGRTRNLLPIVIGFGVVVAGYLLIGRYYRRTYGRVEPAGRTPMKDVVFAVLILAVVIGALRLDDGTLRALMAGKAAQFPVSMYALLFGSVVLLDYIRNCRRAGVKNLGIFPAGWACAGGIILSAFLPLLGDGPAALLGFRSVLFLVFAIDGILILLYSMAGHRFLARSLSGALEAERGQPV